MSFIKILLPGWATFSLKVFIFLSTFYFLYEALLTENAKPETWLISLSHIIQNGEGLLIFLAGFLIFFNWGIEAIKWQLLAKKLEKITFWQAYRAVLVGVCLGFITPNRLGDYAGRVLSLKSRQRLEGLGAVFLGRFCQLGITVATGSVGIFFFLINYFAISGLILLGIAISFILVNAALGLLLFRPRILISALLEIPFLKQYTRYVAVILNYSARERIYLLQLSFGRYLVFVGQFMLLLAAFNIQLPWWQMALGVSATFLFKSLVPSLSSLSDLGMRELSAIYFFSLLGQNKLLVMSASLSLWFLNIALPSLVGLTLVGGIRWQILKNKKVNI